jgi:hypothetical protein
LLPLLVLCLIAAGCSRKPPPPPTQPPADPLTAEGRDQQRLRDAQAEIDAWKRDGNYGQGFAHIEEVSYSMETRQGIMWLVELARAHWSEFDRILEKHRIACADIERREGTWAAQDRWADLVSDSFGPLEVPAMQRPCPPSG